MELSLQGLAVLCGPGVDAVEWCVCETLRVQGDGEAGPAGTSSYPALFIHSAYHSL